MVRVLKKRSLMHNLRHHSLVAWQCADDLFIKLHVLTRERFPPLERYELGSQIRRAAYSFLRTSLKDLPTATAGHDYIF
jgi:hypothetical protein